MKRVLDDLTVFCTVVEVGSLKKASEKLAIPHSTVSRRIEALEQNLGLTLLHRTTREVKASTRGLELYQQCSPMLAGIQQSIDVAIDAEVQFKGHLKVSLPVRAGIDFLGAWLIDFSTQHPELSLDISLSNDKKNLIKDEIDLAFRVGPLTDSSAIALHLWDIPYGVYAHPSLLKRHNIHTTPIALEQLKSLPCVIARPTTLWAFTNSQQQTINYLPVPALEVDDLGLARHAALSGHYAALLPTVMVDEGSELDLLPIHKLQPLKRQMYAYYLGRRHAQSQIKHLIDYIKQRNNTWTKT